jgi:bacteriorhodopsin
MQSLTLIYLAAYLLIGGCGFLVAPALALRLLLSNGAYGDIMPRVVGLFMFVLGGVIVQFVRARDYRYYLYTIGARSFIVVVMTALYFKARDPLFLVLDAIVLIGLLPSIYVAAQSARSSKGG